MKRILIFALLLAACAPQISYRAPLATPVIQSSIRVYFPLYIYPSGAGLAAWNRVAAANVYKNIDVIVNPNNGPGVAVNSNYVKGIAALRVANVGIYGYVYTGYGNRPIADVKADVDRWLSFYGSLTGIFVDEAEYRSYEPDLPYYQELYAYIQSKGMKAVNNPGIGTTEAYSNTADTTCIFEAPITRALVVQSWWWNYAPSKFCYLAHSASVDQMRAMIPVLKSSNIYYAYITDATSNYWGSVPAYFEEEVALMSNGVIPPPVTSTLTSTPSAVPSSTPTRTPIPATNTPTKTLIPATIVTDTPVPTRTATPAPISLTCMDVVFTLTINGTPQSKICFMP